MDCHLVDFAILVEKYLDLARELKKLWNVNNSDADRNWNPSNSLQETGKVTGGNGNQRKNLDHSIF